MKKVLPVAVLAALAGVNSAQAVHVNPDGLGQVLLYPFYTTNGGNDTLIQVVNTTDEFKAVKVRILESMNSQEVLDFNLYLSPQDHWSAAIIATDNGGASIVTGDTSCTVPNRLSDGETIAFRPILFDGTQPGSVADSVAGIDRTKEGYIEIIEMGVLIDSEGEIADAIEHVDGTPGDCPFLDARWNAQTGFWGEDDAAKANDDFDAPTGGLYGYGVLIDVPAATDATYDAVALDNWTAGAPLHTTPGNLFPNLGDSILDFNLYVAGESVAGSAADGWDAVSAILMTESLSNDYVLEPTIGAGTDWVITFPTKRNYVNSAEPVSPFTDTWDPETSTACESFGIEYWDREEGTPQTPPSENDFSPRPIVEGPDPFALCWEANVLTFNGADVLGSGEAGRSGSDFTLEDGYDNGWARLDFAGPADRVLTTSAGELSGLPAIGFAVQRYVNGNTENGATNNYAGVITHKNSRTSL